MTFGQIDVAMAQGTILAHSVMVGRKKFRKGRHLTNDDVAALRAHDITKVWAARLDADDVHEDQAAGELAAALATLDIDARAPFTGRANLVAGREGVIAIDAACISAINAIDEALTVATIPPLTRVEPRSLLATIKIIPYAMKRVSLDMALGMIVGTPIALHPFAMKSATLVLTQTDGTPASLINKGARAIQDRLGALGLRDVDVVTVAHDITALSDALGAARGELVLILGASATSDRRDVCPAAVVACGGTIERFGMPVDPGNLLFLGALGGRPLIGLPGCARSPALNGADWVLQRIVAGLAVTDRDIAAMGVGGLLKEIPTRPQPRQGNAKAPRAPKISVVVLAAGKSTRMAGADKLLRDVEGEPLLRRTVRAAMGSAADEVIVVTGQGFGAARRKVLDGLDITLLDAAEAATGMGGSIRAGIRAVAPETDAVILALADMPQVTSKHFDHLIAAFDPAERRSIARAQAQDGTPGHPVLFGRRFFESLSHLDGDEGARSVVAEAGDYVVDVPTPGQGAVIDLDTPSDWARWEAGKSHTGKR